MYHQFFINLANCASNSSSLGSLALAPCDDGNAPAWAEGAVAICKMTG